VTSAPEGQGTALRNLLKTKLGVPTLRSAHVPRPTLLEILRASSERKLTLISAPVGYGKTTLLTQWCQSEDGNLPCAWVSLDEQDNDVVRLWRHVIEALRQVAPSEGFGADALVGLSVAGTKLVETLLPMLINELTELPHRVVLVFDDYHCIKESACHESVAFFIEHLPDTVHVVLSTRSYPPLSLGRLRARGEMDEIRTDQLAFSEEEATTLLKEGLQLDIGPSDLLVLLERTEGWPAGIYLAGLSLRGKLDAHVFIESFHGSNRHVVDLLGEEMLVVLPEAEKQFLLRTSVLERMSGSLCDAVVETEGSAKILRELSHSNLFVIALSEEEEWYRYHHLFADFLRYELTSTQPELVPVLHRRASTWFEREGLVGAAIRHAIAAGEYARTGTLIARHWLSYLATGQTATLERWLDALPEDLVSGEAALALVKAWISAAYGRGEERERYLALAEGNSYEGRLPDGTTSVESGVALLRAVFAYGGVQSIVEAARRAATQEPEITSPRAGLVRFGLGSGLYLSGDISQARKPLEEALELLNAGQPLVRIAVLSALSLVNIDEGHLEEAEALAREARALVSRFGLQEIPQATLASIALGRVLAGRGELSEAQTELESALSVRRRLPDLSPWPTLIGLLALAPVRLRSGDRAGARAVLTEARATLETLPDAGMFPERLERHERMLRQGKQRERQLNGELTERELDVLGLLDGERNTQQIGRVLYVAPNTVKTHIKSIYRKLGVSSRTDAVEQARARGLIRSSS
jgi:LuxR family transcriptional regulator, maltose regulon positive regulatory protein